MFAKLLEQLRPLKDTGDSLVVENIMTDEERMSLVEACASLINDFIDANPLVFSSPDYQTTIRNEVTTLLEATLLPSVGIVEEEELDLVYQMASYIVFTSIVPRRSYRKTFVRKVRNHEAIQRKLADIRSRPQSEQCTDQWYLDRWNRLSGSNAWKAFSTQSQLNSLIVEKCKPIEINKYRTVNTESPLHHGKRFEPVSTMYYEYTYGAKIAEFGCVPHSTHSFLGASPDGIVVNPECPRYGRMLEIKNVTTRKINGIPKEDYWIQMQIQMEVCDLNECDFLETQISSYPSYEEFAADGTFQKSADDKYKGVILYFQVDGQPFYEYAPFQCTEDEFETWQEEMMQLHSNHTWVSNIYYRIDLISCVLVLRNKKWMEAAIIRLREVWNQILHDRQNGYEHRLPRSRIGSKRSATVSNIEYEAQTANSKPRCLINIAKIGEQFNRILSPQDISSDKVSHKSADDSMNTEDVDKSGGLVAEQTQTLSEPAPVQKVPKTKKPKTQATSKMANNDAILFVDTNDS